MHLSWIILLYVHIVSYSHSLSMFCSCHGPVPASAFYIDVDSYPLSLYIVNLEIARLNLDEFGLSMDR